jgi:hypothetical protein
MACRREVLRKITRNWWQMGDISKKIVGSTCTANGHVCTISTKCCICVCRIQLDSRIKRRSSWRRIVRSRGVWWRSRPYSFLFNSEAWFYRSGYWSADKIIFLNEVPLHDRLVCGGSAARITGPLFVRLQIRTGMFHTFWRRLYFLSAGRHCSILLRWQLGNVAHSLFASVIFFFCLLEGHVTR